MKLFKREKIVERHIGPETDEYLYERIINQLTLLGAEIVASTDAHGGSQDVVIDSFKLKGSKIKVIRETYVGMSIVGEKELIDFILSEFNKEKK